MDSDQIHIAVSRLDNWSVEMESPGVFILKRFGRFIMPCDSEPAAWMRTPRYTCERDEIIEVVKRLCQDLSVRVRFLNALRELLPQPASDFDMMVATAEQLCVALLKAMKIPLKNSTTSTTDCR